MLPITKLTLSLAAASECSQDSQIHSEYDAGTFENQQRLARSVAASIHDAARDYAAAEGAEIVVRPQYTVVINDSSELVYQVQYEDIGTPLSVDSNADSNDILHRVIRDIKECITVYNDGVNSGDPVVLTEKEFLQNPAAIAAQKIIKSIAKSSHDRIQLAVGEKNFLIEVLDAAAIDLGETAQGTLSGLPDDTRRRDLSFLLSGNPRIPRIRTQEEDMKTVFEAQKEGARIKFQYHAKICYQYGATHKAAYTATDIKKEPKKKENPKQTRLLEND